MGYLSYFLNNVGIEPEEKKPKMKAQLREVLKSIQGANTPPTSRYRSRLGTSSQNNMSKVVLLSGSRNSSRGAGVAELTSTINKGLLNQRSMNIIPCRTPITKINNKNAKPYVNLNIRSSAMKETPRKYTTNTKILECLFMDEPSNLLYNESNLNGIGNEFPRIKLQTVEESLKKRRAFLEKLKEDFDKQEKAQMQNETKTKYFKRLS